ncbi:MAG: hypothetical protein L6R40_006836 [Gallowayella cf. fulva]|nr:MAG: hypothetical protein L6R40_006836 [Xanthomendoza cf. fulva]
MTHPLSDTNHLNSPFIEEVDCTPDTKSKIKHLKRKASQIRAEGSPSTTAPWLQWRFVTVQNELALRRSQIQALRESKTDTLPDGRSKMEWLKELRDCEKELDRERLQLLTNRKIMEGDLNDIAASADQLASAYIQELRTFLYGASNQKEKYPGPKTPRLERRPFADRVNDYLGTLTLYETGDRLKYCNVIGYWLGPESIKCAHIVPLSWDTKDLAYLFGSDEPPLTSKRNGLSLQTKIEEAFEKCWVVIVPDDTTESIPTNWKLRVLNPAILNESFFTDLHGSTDKRLWRFSDIDNRRLTFPNDNRPARRFLYLRYTLAWLHADAKGWEDFNEKVPPGTVWASPNKPDGYLRKSILLELGKRTGANSRRI